MRKVIRILMAVMAAALMISCSNGGGGDDGQTKAEVDGYDATGTWVFSAEFQPSCDGQEPPFDLPSDGMQVDFEQSGDTFVATIFGAAAEGAISGNAYSCVYMYPSDPAIPVTVSFTLTSETTATGTAQTTISDTTYTYALTGTKSESGSAIIYAD